MTPTVMTVREVMDPHPILVEPTCPIQSVLDLMNDRRIGSVIVAENKRLRGIFTERDLLRYIAAAETGWRAYPVRDWMTADPHTISPNVGWQDAIDQLESRQVRHLPVIENQEVIGIISSRLIIAHRTEILNASVAQRTTELKQVNDLLLARDAEHSHYLRSAERIQNHVLLPQSPPDWPELRWAIHYVPLDHLGGDYYDFATPSPDHFGFLIADASGHSIPAALVAIMTRFAFAEVAMRTIHPGEVLTEMNRRLQSLIEDRFVTAFYGVADRRTGVLRYASAGHPYPYQFIRSTGKVKPLTGQGFMLGIMPEEQYTERETVLEPGDRLCFFTDGLTEARNEIGELFGNDRVIDCMAANTRLSSKEMLAQLLDDQRVFSGAEKLTDDITIVIADILSAEEATA